MNSFLSRIASLRSDAGLAVALIMPLSSEEDQAPEQKMEEQEEEPPAQARELALGLSIVRELHTSRVCALDGETERKLRISANVFRRRSSSWVAVRSLG